MHANDNTCRLSEETHRILRQVGDGPGNYHEGSLAAGGGNNCDVRLHAGAALVPQYAALRQDPKAWAEVLAERKLFEQAIADGVR